MKHFDIPIWKTSPFIRLLLPLIAGIILQWYLPFSSFVIIISIVGFSLSYILFGFLPIAFRYKLSWIQGLLINLLLMNIGMALLGQNDIRKRNDWFGKKYNEGDYLVVRINEPVIEKAKSYKAEGIVETVINKGSSTKTTGKILLYFAKDSAEAMLQYGDKILLSKTLQPIKNSGNPGAFNYKRYASFQQIFHNVYLKRKDWVLLDHKSCHPFRQYIFNAREKILSILRVSVGQGKDELGIAEALLIGYTNDLDKDLQQAYSNTGVVHIIAISGMHLGLIYVMLVWLFARTPLIKRSKTTQVILILTCLWLFSFLTGAAASIIRSAVMFTFITIGKNFGKKTSIYNSLAASAFVMLCYNPYYLWDVGFQLSYFALIGIVVFQKPIYNLFFVRNKWLDKIWELMAVSLAAQILTFPVCIYYFHQFPNLFLITNMIAVPLSSIILFAEIALVAFSWIPIASLYLGKLTEWLVWLMNKTILFINSFSFAVWDKIPASVLSTGFLYAVVICISLWLIKKSSIARTCSLFFLLLFTIVQVSGKWEIRNQQKIIVYNVPQHQAIDIINGNNYQFIGDSILQTDGMLQNFHLKPGRIFLQLDHPSTQIQNSFQHPPFFQINNKRIVVIDKFIDFTPVLHKIDIDVIVISKNPKITIHQLANVFNCRQFVFDASNSLWKIGKWQKECEALLLRCYSVPDSGAYVIELGS